MVAPPCGERGLKWLIRYQIHPSGCRSPLRGAWIEIVNLMIYQGHKAVAPPCGERGLK